MELSRCLSRPLRFPPPTPPQAYLLAEEDPIRDLVSGGGTAAGTLPDLIHSLFASTGSTETQYRRKCMQLFDRLAWRAKAPASSSVAPPAPAGAGAGAAVSSAARRGACKWVEDFVKATGYPALVQVGAMGGEGLRDTQRGREGGGGDEGLGLQLYKE